MVATCHQTASDYLIDGYRLCAVTEGKSPNAIAIVVYSVKYFLEFLVSQGWQGDISKVTQHEIRAFILYLQRKRCFSNHPLNHPKEKGLSGHTINCYLRSLRIFFSWLVSEGIIESNPFAKVKIPHPPRKVIPTFSDSQIQQLLSVIDISSPEGFRDYTIILTLLDTGMRVSELCSIRLDNVRLEDGFIKVLGKGNKERIIPIGKQVQKLIWRYVTRYRPHPLSTNGDFLFLTRDGRPLTKDRVEKTIARYGKKANITGVRCSPHTFRHTAAIKFLRNGGDVFSLQKMLGHASLEMTRRYCELAEIDVKRAHTTASPVDNLTIKLNPPAKSSPSNKKNPKLRQDRLK